MPADFRRSALCGGELERLTNTVGNLIEICWINKHLSKASNDWYMMRETQRGKVSSNSRFQTVPFQQYSANLSVLQRVSCLPYGRGFAQFRCRLLTIREPHPTLQLRLPASLVQ